MKDKPHKLVDPSDGLTFAEVEYRVRGLPQDIAARTVCALVGHSRVQTQCFGYYSCFRCQRQVGDNLLGGYAWATKVVIPGHDCSICRANEKKLTWRDLFLSDYTQRRINKIKRKKARSKTKSK